MKRIDFIWVLALAGTVMACNSGSPLTACTVDLVTGKCEGRDVPPVPGPPGPGTGGTGGTGVEPGAFTNRNTCINNVEPTCTDPLTCNCDYGCVAIGNTFGLEAILNVIPDEAFEGDGEFDVEFDGEFTISEAFIAGAENVLGDLNTAAIGALPNSLPVTALSGATGVDTVVTLTPADPQPPAQTCQSLPAPGCLDLDLDPDGNGTPGPFPLPFVRTTGTYTFGASGTQACFNLTSPIEFNFTITESNGGPIFFPADFACQPVDQEGINLTNIDCTDDADCADFGTTCNVPQLSCTAVVTPQPAAGQVCFDIP